MFCSRKTAIPIFMIFVLVFLILSGIDVADSSEAGEENSKFVSIDFNNVDINVFIKFMSKLTGKNFVVDSRVKGKVTIISPTKISVEDAYKVFESVLEINGISTVTSGKIIKIVPTPVAKADNLDTQVVTGPGKPGSLDDGIVTRLIPLEFATSDELKKLFTPLIPKGSVVLSYRDTNMLIVTATRSSINRLLKIIKVIDVQSIGKKISVIPVKYADVNKLVKNLSAIFAARVKGKKGKADSGIIVKFVADERTNSVILLASKTESQRVKDLIDILDQKVPKGEEKIRVYYLEHASAENLVKVLLEIPAKDSKSTGASGAKKAPILSAKVKIMADKATNSLVIMADKEDYPVLEEVIKKLDIPRSMVYIECLIMEVNVTRGLTIGTEWQTSNTGKSILGGFTGTGDNLSDIVKGTLPQGFSVGVLGEAFNIGGVEFSDINAVVQAFQTDKDVNILATPQILTTENEEATIVVGKNVPFQTRSAAETGTETYSSYEYKDVGITLKITPQISKDRLVRLNVYQELTKLDTLTNIDNDEGDDRPTTFKRQIETTIIVEDSHSVVIGGLIDESTTITEHKTPCLGDIPGLGWAFKTVSEEIDKTNLYVFLTPKVIKNPLEADEIYREKKQDIDAVKRGEVSLYEKVDKLSPFGENESGEQKPAEQNQAEQKPKESKKPQ